MSAIDTTQANMGNRTFMHFVSEHYQQQVHDIAQDGFRDAPWRYPYQDRIQQAFGEQHADRVVDRVVRGQSAESLLNQPTAGSDQSDTVPNSAESPLQMMWPALAGRGLSPVRRASMLKPGGTSPGRPGMLHDLYFNPRRHVWNKDILFGVDNRDTLELAVKLEAATDSVIQRGRYAGLKEHFPHAFPSGALWDKHAFNFADRSQLKRRDRPYLDYPREAITTAIARGGSIYWALGHLNFNQVFSELFRTQVEFGTDPVEYMAKVSFPELIEKHGKFVDADTGEEVKQPLVDLNAPMEKDVEAAEQFEERVKKGEIKNVTPFRPLITTTEIIGFLMGDEKKYLDKTTFFNARHNKADQADFLTAFYETHARLRTRQAELGPVNDYKLERSVYGSLDKHTFFPCGHCGEIFLGRRSLEEHWENFPEHET